MQPEERDAAYLWDMRQAALEAMEMLGEASLEDFRSSLILMRAMERCIEIIGESAKRVSPAFSEQHPEIPWRQIIGQRNISAHEYGQIDHDLLYRTAVEDLPELVVQLERSLPPVEDQE